MYQQEKLKKLIDTLREIAEYDANQRGFIDEWEEATAFNVCRDKANQVLIEIGEKK